MKTKQIRRDILIASYYANACHIGSALSCVDILVELFYKVLKKNDIFLFSKASGVAALYAVLADKGYFPKSKLVYYLKNYPLASKEVPGVIHSVGSLGHGLPVAVGLAYANPRKQVYVLMSDGECQEGTTMEASLFANHHNLENLHILVDANSYQALGQINDILNIQILYFFLDDTLPNVDIIKTIKGDGVDFMEYNNDWHYRNLTKEELKKALCQI